MNVDSIDIAILSRTQVEGRTLPIKELPESGRAQAKRSWRRLSAVAAAGVAGLAGFILMPAASGQAGVTLSITPQSGPIGTTIRFSGSGCPSGGTFRIALAPSRGENGALVPEVNFTSSGGSFSGAVDVPATLPRNDGSAGNVSVQPGAKPTTVLCLGGGGASGPDFTVLAAAEPAQGAGTTTTTLAPSGGSGSAAVPATTPTTVRTSSPADPSAPASLALTG